MKHILRAIVFLFVAVVLPLSIAAQAHADSFNANDIIDDSVFNNTSSMNAGQINNWLNSNFPSSCISTNNGFSSPDPTGYSPSTGYTYGGNVSGGQVIYDAAQAYGLNPQVLIATLQKESSVVSGTASYHCQYINTAMGYGCPDSGSCPTNPATMSGFSKQVIHAAWLFKFGQQRSIGNTGWNVQLNNFPQGGDHWDNSDDPPTCYGGPMTQGTLSRGCGQAATFYDGYDTIDGTSVHMNSGATASLYWYTPHFSGNQNFFNIYTSWFGSTHDSVIVAQANGVGGLWAVYGGAKQLIASPTVEKAWGLFNLPVTTMDAGALNSLPARPTLTLLAVNPFSSGGNPAYMLADQGGTFDALPSVIQDWGMDPSSASSIGPELVAFTQRLGSLSGIVSSPGQPGDYLMDGGTLRVISSPTVLNMWGGGSPNVNTISSDLFGSFATGSGITGNQITSGGNSYLIDNGGLYRLSGILAQIYPHDSQTSISNALVNATPNAGTPSRFISSPGIPGIFLVDNSQRHVLGSPGLLQSYHAAGESSYVTSLSQTGMNSITAGSGIATRFVYNLSSTSQYYYMNITLRSLSSQFQANNYGVGLSTTTLNWLGTPSGPACVNDFVSGDSGNTGIFLMDNGLKRPISDFPEYQLLNSNPSQECQMSQEDFSQIPSGPTISPLASNGGTNYLLDSGHRYAVNAAAQQGWNLANFVPIGSGALANYTDGGNLSNTITLNGSYVMVSDGNFYSTSNATVAALWGADYSQAHSLYVISYIHNSGALSQFAVSNSPSHGGIFLVDQGKFTLIPNPDSFFNAGYTGQNLVGVNDTYLTANTNSGAWQGYLAKDATSGTIYVLEGGNKHVLPSGQQSKWVGSPQTVTPTTFSSNFLGLLSNGADVTNSFASPDVPGIYAMTNAKKFVIPDYPTYTQSYAPYLKVNSHLVNAVPSQ